MPKNRTLKRQLCIILKTIYWEYLSTIDDPWKYGVNGMTPRYLPSFFKIYTPEEAEEIIEEDRKFFQEKLEALGRWEEAWKAKEAGLISEAPKAKHYL